MAEIKVKTTPRFNGKDVALVGFACFVVFGLLVWVLLVTSNVFDITSTTTKDAAGKSTVTTSNELATAKFSIVVLVAVGGSVLLAGFALALTEVAMQESAATTPDAAPAEVTTRSVTASGIGAVFVAVGETAKALGSALKGLTASAMLILMGGLMVIMSGAVAWQTIPGTDTSPTIEVSDATPSPTPAEGSTPTPTESPSPISNPTPTLTQRPSPIASPD